MQSLKKKKVKKSNKIVTSEITKVDLSMDFSSGSLGQFEDKETTTASLSLSKNITSLEDNFNINKLVKKILGSELGVPLDVKIDDSSMPTAPNFVTFLNSPDFLNVKGFARQNEIGTKLFSEFCPRCTDMNWFNNVPVNASYRKFIRKVTLLEFGVCPKCGIGKSELIKNGELNSYQELAGCAGQRSAKSALVAMIAAYIVHRYLKLQNPVQLMGLIPATILHGTFVALTYAQAKDTLWDPFMEYLSNSPWFSGYHQLLSTYNEKYGEEIFKLKDTFILYRHRNLILYPSGPNKKTLRGRTRFFGAIDEIGWFDNDAQKNKVKDDANEIYIAMERSLLTVRAAANRLLKQGYDNIPTAFFANVSSPSHARDKVMELVNKAKISKKIFAFHRPTWEMNPNVTKEDLEDEYKKDPVAAERDYGANPPLANSPLINNIEYVEQCSVNVGNKLEQFKYKQHKNKKDEPSRYGSVILREIINPTILTLDAGFSNNSFACVVSSIDKTTKFVSYRTFIEIQPKPGVPLNYSLIYKHVIKPIIEKQNVKLVATDRWQNLKLLSDIEQDYNIETKQYSVKYSDMTLFKDYIIDKEVIFPRCEWKTMDEVINFNYADYPKCFAQAPVAHFFLQCVTVQDTGHTVTKGGGLTDDLFRAAALGFALLQDEKYIKMLQGPDGRLAPVAMGAAITKSGGGASSHGAMSGMTSTGKALGIIGGGR
jgi:hypothetical protein